MPTRATPGPPPNRARHCDEIPGRRAGGGADCGGQRTRRGRPTRRRRAAQPDGSVRAACASRSPLRTRHRAADRRLPRQAPQVPPPSRSTWLRHARSSQPHWPPWRPSGTSSTGRGWKVSGSVGGGGSPGRTDAGPHPPRRPDQGGGLSRLGYESGRRTRGARAFRDECPPIGIQALADGRSRRARSSRPSDGRSGTSAPPSSRRSRPPRPLLPTLSWHSERPSPPTSGLSGRPRRRPPASRTWRRCPRPRVTRRRCRPQGHRDTVGQGLP